MGVPLVGMVPGAGRDGPGSLQPGSVLGAGRVLSSRQRDQQQGQGQGQGQYRPPIPLPPSLLTGRYDGYPASYLPEGERCAFPSPSLPSLCGPSLTPSSPPSRCTQNPLAPP